MLVKYCNSEHNSMRGSKLLIGNLEKYRKIENDGLRDDGEGQFDFSIEFLEGARISSAWANLIFNGAIGFGDAPSIRLPGKFSAHIENMKIRRVEMDAVSFEYAKAKISYEVLNPFVFCCSDVNDSSMENCPFDFYDDSWTVAGNSGGADNFAVRVANMLMQQITLDNLDIAPNILTLNHLKRIGLNVMHRPVSYIERDLKITPDLAENFDHIMEAHLNIPFCKPEKYAPEREYRFLFTPVIDGRSIPVKNLDVFLDLNGLTAPQ